MTFIDHAAFGLIITNIQKKNDQFKYYFFGLLCSLFPDIPALFGFPGSVLYLSHRTLTHSLILAPFFSVIPLLIWTILFRKYIKNDFLTILQISVVSYYGHIFYDLLTPFGVKLFHPISKKTYSFDLFLAFDPIFLAISFCFLGYFMFSKLKKSNVSKITVLIFLICYFSYSIVTLCVKSGMKNKYETYCEKNFSTYQYLSTIPRTFLRWKCIGKSKSDEFIVIVKDNKQIKHKKYVSRINNPEIFNKVASYNQFLSYARYPIITQVENEVSLINLIYSPNTYKLTLIFEDNKLIKEEVSGFDLLDKIF